MVQLHVSEVRLYIYVCGMYDTCKFIHACIYRTLVNFLIEKTRLLKPERFNPKIFFSWLKLNINRKQIKMFWYNNLVVCVTRKFTTIIYGYTVPGLVPMLGASCFVCLTRSLTDMKIRQGSQETQEGLLLHSLDTYTVVAVCMQRWMQAG